MPMRPCDVCGTVYEAKRPSSRFCGGSCRKRNTRNPQPRPGTGEAAAAVLPEGGSSAGLIAATMRELEAAGRLDTMLGQQALEIAARIKAPATTGAAVATLSRELRAVVADALRGAQVAADPLDELRARRDAKLAG